jgi:methionine-rich copper-binding protein CopC
MLTRGLPVLAAVLTLSTQTAFAHAHLKTATPAPDSTAPVAPHEVVIDFTEGVEPNFSSIAVEDAAGGRVDAGAAHLAGGATHLAIDLKPLKAGLYKVIWHATAVDTHKTAGTFNFTVAP